MLVHSTEYDGRNSATEVEIASEIIFGKITWTSKCPDFLVLLSCLSLNYSEQLTNLVNELS